MAGDRIHLLTEAVCNLVRAQEVVNNPAAAVKELLDNAIDAGATSIQLDISGGGKRSVHVVDNGCGMSLLDARMAFERHATSKIRTKEDLDNIQTLGFRGEGLASIATVSKVELRTRREEDEIGTEVIIAGGEFIKQSSVVTPVGTSIRMNDIYYNVPGRRRSLKKESAEERLIDSEFTQSALVHPNIAYQYYKDGQLFKELRPSSLKERIIAIAGRSLEKKLLPLHYESAMLTINGYFSHPDQASKTGVKQYFFANNRYIKHDYFRRAIEQVFEPLVPQGNHPHYFIYFQLPSDHLDVNIHPSKKEVRFLDETHIYQLLLSLIKDALSTHVAIPSIDFDNPTILNIPTYVGREDVLPSEPSTHQTSDEGAYVKRVFMGGADSISPRFTTKPHSTEVVSSDKVDWDKWEAEFAEMQEDGILLSETNPTKPDITGGYLLSPLQHGVFQGEDFPTTGLLIYKGRYIVTTLKRSLALVDLRRAHTRVLYERYLVDLSQGNIETQALMFPEEIDFSTEEHTRAEKLMQALSNYGFTFKIEAEATYQVTGAPSSVVDKTVDLIQNLLVDFEEDELTDDKLKERISLYLSSAKAYSYGSKLERYEIDDLIANLFASSNPNFDPYNRRIISLIDEQDIERRFS